MGDAVDFGALGGIPSDGVRVRGPIRQHAVGVQQQRPGDPFRGLVAVRLPLRGLLQARILPTPQLQRLCRGIRVRRIQEQPHAVQAGRQRLGVLGERMLAHDLSALQIQALHQHVGLAGRAVEYEHGLRHVRPREIGRMQPVGHTQRLGQQSGRTGGQPSGCHCQGVESLTVAATVAFRVAAGASAEARSARAFRRSRCRRHPPPAVPIRRTSRRTPGSGPAAANKRRRRHRRRSTRTWERLHRRMTA